MKLKTFFALSVITILTATGLSSCKKSSSEKENNTPYVCATCKTTPEALPENDFSSKGIYKGVVTNPSGTIEFNILNRDTTITARMVINGITVNLTSEVPWIEGRPYIATFTGTMNGEPLSIDFIVQANGEGYYASSSHDPMHNDITFHIAKETSSSLIECFEGTYHSTKPEDGTFNIILSRALKTWIGEIRPNGSTGGPSIGGTITGDSKIMGSYNLVLGTLSGDEINGSFKGAGTADTLNFTIKAKRTL